MVMFLHCMEPFRWEYFPQFPEYDHLSLGISEAMNRLRSICRDVRDGTNRHAAQYVAKRKEARLAYIIQQFPTFLQDCEIFGKPGVVMPLPTWRVWRVQEWWYVAQCRIWPSSEWFLSETHWLRNLNEFAELDTKVGGLLVFRRFYLRSYIWDYEDRWLVEEVHT